MKPMPKLIHPTKIALHIHLALMRADWFKLLAALLLVLGVFVWTSIMPRLRLQLSEQQALVKKAQQDLAIQLLAGPTPVTPPTAEIRLQHFYATLGDNRYAEQQIKTLFAIAKKNGLVLRQADYASSYDANGRFNTYRISLPVKGSYAAIRAFSEQVLQALPFASLDEMNFKRESIGSTVLEAKLGLTLYLNVEDKAANAAVAANAPARDSL